MKELKPAKLAKCKRERKREGKTRDGPVYIARSLKDQNEF